MIKRERGFYWVRIPQRTPGGPTHSDVVAFTHGDGRWFFAGLDKPRGESEAVVLGGPLKFEPGPAPAAPFERLTAKRDDLMSAISIIARERAELAANLTATQARCTELLDEARAMGRTIRAQDAAIQSLENTLSATQEELRANTEVQAQTIRRLHAIGYRVVKRCGACVSFAFERT
jgi:hypothetical protein